AGLLGRRRTAAPGSGPPWTTSGLLGRRGAASARSGPPWTASRAWTAPGWTLAAAKSWSLGLASDLWLGSRSGSDRRTAAASGPYIAGDAAPSGSRVAAERCDRCNGGDRSPSTNADETGLIRLINFKG